MSNIGFERGGFKRSGRFLQRARGFTLIEVMIAVLVLGIGLLGLAMLQTMSVRFAQSANYRTQATNLAYDMLDQMRVNRRAAASYAGNYAAAANTANCGPGATVDPTEFRGVWECRLLYALGADASAVVGYTEDGTGGDATVEITWGDERWQVDEALRDQSFDVVTRL
ncbi:MAG TPA: type IV pilus modification protein PilV [Pseudoxanthomonas sp.]